jgi:hypothetical protein
MRKFFGIVFCLVALTSSAQLKLGINAGYHMAQFAATGSNTGDYDLSAVNGYHFGLIADEKLSKEFYLNIGLEFNHKGGIVNKSSQALTGTNYTMSLNYLQIPIILNYKIPITKTSSFILGGGFYTAFGLSGKLTGTSYYTTITNVDEKIDFTNNSSNSNINVVKPLSWGYIFNTGIEWKKYQFKFNYAHDFNKLKPTGSTKFYNVTYGISAAYLLPW